MRVAVVDDHPLMREALVWELSNTKLITVVTSCPDGETALRLRYRPDQLRAVEQCRHRLLTRAVGRRTSELLEPWVACRQSPRTATGDQRFRLASFHGGDTGTPVFGRMDFRARPAAVTPGGRVAIQRLPHSAGGPDLAPLWGRHNLEPADGTLDDGAR